MATQEERRERTRSGLLEAAAQRFGVQGFAETTIDQIAEDAGTAKGALYHYFPTKTALFEAVLNGVSADVAEQTQKAITGGDLLEAMMTAVRAFFAACAEPKTSQILLRDGPSVLGWDRWREIDSAHFGGAVTSVLSLAMESGALRDQPVEPLARLLLGAISEAVIDCAGQPHFEEHAEAYISGIEALLNGLRPTP
ncbi:MAG: TetR/AcrR family transcriptional regulator [Myxococcota bacterium]